VGFSQGGYLAPFVALNLTNVIQVVGIGAGYLNEELDQTPTFRWDGIHGDQDTVVQCPNARESHAQLAEKGIAGEFRVLPGVGHELNDLVAGCLRSVFALPSS
jgi:predicted esterase